MKHLLFTSLLILSLYSCKNDTDQKKIFISTKYDTTFNSTIWKTSNLFEKGRMVKDIKERNLLQLMPIDSVIKLLGNPTEKGKDFINFLVGTKDTVHNQNYLLLHVEFDSNKKVVDYWITD